MGRTPATVAGALLSIALLAFVWAVAMLPRNHGPDLRKRDQVLEAAGGLTFCRYDGHCPVGSTCSVSSSPKRLGFCEPIVVAERESPLPPPQHTETSRHRRHDSSSRCLRSCMRELELDEHFYQERWPVVELEVESIRSAGRPVGCGVIYRRVAEPVGRWKELEEKDRQVSGVGASWRLSVTPSVREWTERRFRHVIRVDPYYSDKNSRSRRSHSRKSRIDDNLWMAYCLRPCWRDTDCATDNDGKKPNRQPTAGFVCRAGACQRNRDYWNHYPLDGDGRREPPSDEEASEQEQETVLVTAASAGSACGLENLLASARHWAPRHRYVVYNLGGLTDDQIATIDSWPNVLAVEWRYGVPSHYPDHVRAGRFYSWKPIIINETLHKYRTAVFWQDAASTWTGPIAAAEEILRRTGSFLVKGQDANMGRYSHPDTYQYLGFDKETFEGGPHFARAIQGWLYPNRYLESVVRANAACAIDEKCIAPTGSNAGNHRFDKTTLSVLSYHPRHMIPHYTEYLAVSRTQLNDDLSRPSFKFIWQAQQACRFYSQLYNMSNMLGDDCS